MTVREKIIVFVHEQPRQRVRLDLVALIWRLQDRWPQDPRPKVWETWDALLDLYHSGDLAVGWRFERIDLRVPANILTNT